SARSDGGQFAAVPPIAAVLAHPVARSFLFFFHATAATEIYTLSLHDALPICELDVQPLHLVAGAALALGDEAERHRRQAEERRRSEEHTSELQSRGQLVCRLLLEKKKNQDRTK